jgi:hypothetical protein
MNDRLMQLKSELQKGQQELALLDRRRQELRDTLLRISGAIQVLEELLELSTETDHNQRIVPAA